MRIISPRRTFLAWIRTSLALMGFGFVVASSAISWRYASQSTVTEAPVIVAVVRDDVHRGQVVVNLLSIRRRLRQVEGCSQRCRTRPAGQASFSRCSELVGIVIGFSI